MDQLVRCGGCGAYQSNTAKFCSECGRPGAAALQPVAAPSAAPPPVRVVKAGRQWRVGGFVAVALGTVLAVAGAASAGLPIAIGGFVAFVVGRLME